MPVVIINALPPATPLFQAHVATDMIYRAVLALHLFSVAPSNSAAPGWSRLRRYGRDRFIESICEASSI